MRSNATSCPYCQYSLCLSCTLCPRSDSNETGIQSSWRKELSCRASHGMMSKMNKITERFVTGFAFSLTTSFAHKCKNTWNTELGYRGRAHTQSQRKILLNYLILGLLKVIKHHFTEVVFLEHQEASQAHYILDDLEWAKFHPAFPLLLVAGFYQGDVWPPPC